MSTFFLAFIIGCTFDFCLFSLVFWSFCLFFRFFILCKLLTINVFHCLSNYHKTRRFLLLLCLFLVYT